MQLGSDVELIVRKLLKSYPSAAGVQSGSVEERRCFHTLCMSSFILKILINIQMQMTEMKGTKDAG